MKRIFTLALAPVLMLVMTLSASAQASLVYVTDYDYSRMTVGGVDNTILYHAKDAASGLVMGQLTADGEQNRAIFSADEWDAMFAPEEWKTTLHDSAGSLCPYVSTHGEHTVCPYLDYSLVTITHIETGVSLENYYVPKLGVTILPGSSVHFCWGRYGFTSPETLKWDGENHYFAVKNDAGLWGVYDTQANALVVDYQFQDISAVYGEYAKVFNGTAWGRLDVTGRFDTVYSYATDTEFSVYEEVRQLSDGTYQVFSPDNEPVSAVYTLTGVKTVDYSAQSHLLYVTYQNQTKELYDLDGELVASFDTTTELRGLQDNCYAAERYDADGALTGIALVRVDDALTPNDTVTKGDVNYDGGIDSRDSRLMLKSLLTTPITARQTAAGDMDNNTVLDTIDVRIHMLQII